MSIRRWTPDLFQPALVAASRDVYAAQSAAEEIRAQAVQLGLLVRRQQQVERRVGLGLDGDDLALRSLPIAVACVVMVAVALALMAVASAVSAV